MSNIKTLLLDTFVLIEIAKNPDWSQDVCKFITQNDYTIVIGTMNLIELYKWEKYWGGVASFISSVKFVVAENPEQITNAEVENYPNEVVLPIAFNPSDYQFLSETLREAIEMNLKGKIAAFEKNYRNEYKSIWQPMRDNRKTYPPDNGKNYSSVEIEVFLQTNVLQWLYTTKYKNFLERNISKSQAIDIKLFKSIYLTLLGLFVEYYINKKDGKPSDVGDFYQMSLLPYVSVAVLDKERHNLIQWINQEGLFPNKLCTYNLADFKKEISR